MLTYSKRRNLFEKGERQWRIEEEGLVAKDQRGAEQSFAWRHVKSIRLTFTPTTATPFRHVTILKFSGGRKAEIDNVHFLGLGNFEDRSAAYAPFAREIVEKVRQFAPSAQAHQGATPVGYYGLIVLAVVMLAAVALVLVLLPTGNATGTVVAKLAIILIMLPTFFLWIRKARPKSIKLDHLSDDALPKVD